MRKRGNCNDVSFLRQTTRVGDYQLITAYSHRDKSTRTVKPAGFRLFIARTYFAVGEFGGHHNGSDWPPTVNKAYQRDFGEPRY